MMKKQTRYCCTQRQPSPCNPWTRSGPASAWPTKFSGQAGVTMALSLSPSMLTPRSTVCTDGAFQHRVKTTKSKTKKRLRTALRNVEGSELDFRRAEQAAADSRAPIPATLLAMSMKKMSNRLSCRVSGSFSVKFPVRETHYSLQLPPGWEYKASWINYPEAKPTQAGNNQWDWVVSDVKAIRKEAEMPPIEGVAGQMILSFFPPGGASANGFSSWLEMGNWYRNLTNGRRECFA